MTVHVICRGSVSMGLGHLLRARSFARAVAPDCRVGVTAILEPGMETLFADVSFSVRFIRFENDLLDGIEPSDVIVLDTPSLDADLVPHLRKNSSLLVSLSPVFDQMDQVDCVFVRHVPSAPMAPVVFAGLQYAVFSEYCRPIPRDVFSVAAQQTPLPVAVCMGGADASNKTLRVLEALVSCDAPLLLWVLLGEGYGHRYDELVRCVRQRPNLEVVLAKTSRSMWRILENCALAVLSGGLTTVEAVYAGLPSINLFERKQHSDLMVESFYDRGVCLNAGVMGSKALREMTGMVTALEKDRLRLLRMHQGSHDLVDDRGAQRVLEALRTQLALRAA